MNITAQTGSQNACGNMPADPFTLRERATFAAGCFRGIEEALCKVSGVIATTVGYMGGRYENPTYDDVCSGMTGHAEVIEVVYDPSQVTYAELLDVFWSIHDPTQYNRQGPDIGSQYRSAIFYHNEEQERTAQASKEQLEASGRHPKPIMTKIEPASWFYKAEDYHQRYFEKNAPAMRQVLQQHNNYAVPAFIMPPG